jgi:hypothetical protein
MKQKMATALVTLMGISLLGYTASRTLNFIRMTLPLDQHDTAYLALVAFDGGLLLWTAFYLHGAKGPWQRGIAALMIVVSLVGVLIGFGADTLYTATGFGLAKMTAGDAQSAIWAMVIIIGLNVAAVTITHMTHPDALRAQAEEEAHDRITMATLEQIKQNATQLAAELAPQLASKWTHDMRSQHLQGIEPAPAPPRLKPVRMNSEVRPPADLFELAPLDPEEAPRPLARKSGRNGNGKV